MEQQMLIAVIITCSLSVAVLVALGRRIVWKSDNQKIKLPPGSAGWPFIGETISFLKAIHSSQHKLRRKFVDEHERMYGPIFRCSLFGVARTIVSVDPEFNKYLLQNEGRLFQAKYPNSLAKIIGKYGLLEVHGELQRKLHGTAVNLLKYEKLSSDFMDDIQHTFLAGMEKWEQQRVIPLEHKCQQLVLNLLGKKLLDLPPSDEMEEVYKAFVQYVAASICVPINIPGTTFARGIKARKSLIKTIYKCMEERRQHPEVAHNDLLTKLLKEGTFSDEIIADLILFLLFAALETSSAAMVFAVMLLTENPRALEELRDEYDAILKAKGKDNQKLTWDDYTSMKFTQCVINETLRLISVSPGVFREPKQDIKYKDFVIPKGWNVFVFLTGQHLDEKYYFEAHKFQPWRWQNEGPELSKNPTFMPFGKGARLCPGWELTEVDRATYFLILSMEKGFPIRLHSRSLE